MEKDKRPILDLDKESETISDNALCYNILKALGCENNIGAVWTYWGGEKIPPHFFDSVLSTKKTVFTKERASVLCSMLAIALNQDFGEELFQGVAIQPKKTNASNASSLSKKAVSDKNFVAKAGTKTYAKKHISSIDQLTYTQELFYMIPLLADIESNKCAQYIFNITAEYYKKLCKDISESLKISETNPFLKTYVDILLEFIGPFIYVFYVRMIHDKFLEKKEVNRSDIATLFSDIFCSATMKNHFLSYKDFKIDRKICVTCKDKFVYRDKYFSFGEKKTPDSLVDGVFEQPARKSSAEKYLDMLQSYTAPKGLLEQTNPDEPQIIEKNECVNLQLFMKMIDDLGLDDKRYGWFIRWFVMNKLFVLEKNKGYEDDLVFPDFYQCINMWSEERKQHYLSVTGIEHTIDSEDYLDFIDYYCDNFFDELSFLRESFLWMAIVNKLFIVKREMVSQSQISECKEHIEEDYEANLFCDDPEIIIKSVRAPKEPLQNVEVSKKTPQNS